MNQLLRILRRNWLLIVLPAIVAAGVALPLAKSQQYYQAQALVTLSPNNPDGATLLGGSTGSPSVNVEDFVSEQLPVFTSPPTIELAAQTAKLPPEQIAGDVGVEAQAAGNVIVTARNAEAGTAVAEANAIARAYLQTQAKSKAADLRAAAKQISSQMDDVQASIDALAKADPKDGQASSLQARRQALASQYSDLLNRRSDTLTLAGLQRGDGRVVQPAAGAATGRSVGKLVLVGALLGLILGLIAALIRDQLLDRMQSREDVEALGTDMGERLVVLGDAPRLRRKHRQQPTQDLAMAEALQTIWLRSQIEADQGVRTIVVTSAEPGAGKTLIASGLASIGAAAAARVVLVSADFWHPDAERRLGVEARVPGLSDWIAARERGQDGPELESMLMDVGTAEFPGLRLLSAGTPATARSAALSPGGLQAALDALGTVADVVILDSPPVLAIPYALVIAKGADLAILVVSANDSRRTDVQRALGALRDTRAIVGVVVNRSREATSYGVDFGDADRASAQPVQA